MDDIQLWLSEGSSKQTTEIESSYIKPLVSQVTDLYEKLKISQQDIQLLKVTKGLASATDLEGFPNKGTLNLDVQEAEERLTEQMQRIFEHLLYKCADRKETKSAMRYLDRQIRQIRDQLKEDMLGANRDHSVP